jgi:hypothetical protein
MRVILAAFALSALSFVAGVAGDLSTPPANAGVAVTLRIPPPIPADAPRARPLPIIRTTAATAAVSATSARHMLPVSAPPALIEQSGPPAPKPRLDRVLRVAETKVDARIAAKADDPKAA